MDKLHCGIITLLRSGVTGEILRLPEEFDMDAAYDMLARHHVLALAYMGAIRCGVNKDLPAMRKLFQGYCRYMFKSEAQMTAVNKLCAEFNAAGIEYMTLKGCNLKEMYRKPELRVMGDADILVRTEQKEEIASIMRKLGYSHVTESDHEIIWRSDALCVELHKRLIPSYNKDYFRYYGDGWQLAKRISGSRFGMEHEDEFIYIFTHFAKHYRDGGIGCRHITDLWVYRWANPDMNEEYISCELEKLSLKAFYDNISKTLKVWFEGAQGDEKTEFITSAIFKSGSWGNKEARRVAVVAKNAEESGSVSAGKVRQAVTMIFPSLRVMRSKYKVLNKLPFLMPIFWPVRWISGILFRRKNVRAQAEMLTAVSADNIRDFRDSLTYVGLDFNFKE